MVISISVAHNETPAYTAKSKDKNGQAERTWVMGYKLRYKLPGTYRA